MSAEAMISTHGSLVTVQRPTYTRDNSGHAPPTFAAHTSVTMWIQPSSQGEGPRYGREATRRTSVGYCRAGVDILAKDRVIWGSRTFDVQGVYAAAEFTRAKGGFLRLDLEENASTVTQGAYA